MKLDVITMGETMVQLNPLQTGPIRSVSHFEKHAAGTESNVAVGVTRMGHTAGWISRVGRDEFGMYILNVLRGENVDISCTTIDPEAPTGLYFVQRSYPVPGQSTVYYYRQNSAASKLCIDDLDFEYISNAQIFHTTGITPALSTSCHEAVQMAINIAKESNVRVSFDTNIRLKLWSPAEAKNTLNTIIPDVNILFIDPRDCEILVGENDPLKAANILLKSGPSLVIVKLGPEGAVAITEEETIMQPGFQVPVTCTIGAGDAFAAGVLASLLKKWPLQKCLQTGNVAGALAVTVRGDTEAVPSLEDVELFLAQKDLR